MPRKVALYARVSTRGQELENQLAELNSACARNDWQIVKVFTDHGISGAKGRAARKGLDDLLKAVVRREVDQVVVWSIDRLGRSLQTSSAYLMSCARRAAISMFTSKRSTPTHRQGKCCFRCWASSQSSSEKLFASASSQGNSALELKVSGSAEEA